MTDFFESVGNQIDPDSFNEQDNGSSKEVIVPVIYQKTQTIDNRISQLKQSVDDFKNQLTIQSAYNPQQQNDLILIETLMRDLQKLTPQKQDVDESYLTRYLKQIGTQAASPNESEQRQFSVIFTSSGNKEQQDLQQRMESRVSLIESILGSQRDRKQFQLEGSNVINQIFTLSNAIKTMKESQTSYKEPIQELYLKISRMQFNNVSDPDSIHKLNIIYDRVQKLQGLSDVLPLLTKRLEQLRDVHLKSTGINQSIQSMVVSHQNVMQLITNNQTKVDALKEKIFTQYNALIKELGELDIKYSKKL